LQVSAISHFANFPTQGIHFMNQLRLCWCAYGWITGLPSNFVEVKRQEQSATAQPCCCQGGFTTGVTCAYDDHIKGVLKFS
jgi:hypothetical protein